MEKDDTGEGRQYFWFPPIRTWCSWCPLACGSLLSGDGSLRHLQTQGQGYGRKNKTKQFVPVRPFLSAALKVNVHFYLTELTPLVSAWPGWILPGRRSDERCAVWGVWRIRWDAAGRPARCNPSNLERWNAAETTKCKFTIYIMAGLGVCSCPKVGTALWEKKLIRLEGICLCVTFSNTAKKES